MGVKACCSSTKRGCQCVASATPWASIVGAALLIVAAIMFLSSFESYLEGYKEIFSSDVPLKLRPVAVIYTALVGTCAVLVLVVGVFSTGATRKKMCGGQEGCARYLRVSWRGFQTVCVVTAYLVGVMALVILFACGTIVGVQVLIWLAGELALEGFKSVSNNVNQVSNAVDAIGGGAVPRQCPPTPLAKCLNLEPFADFIDIPPCICDEQLRELVDQLQDLTIRIAFVAGAALLGTLGVVHGIAALSANFVYMRLESSLAEAAKKLRQSQTSDAAAFEYVASAFAMDPWPGMANAAPKKSSVSGGGGGKRANANAAPVEGEVELANQFAADNLGRGSKLHGLSSDHYDHVMDELPRYSEPRYSEC